MLYEVITSAQQLHKVKDNPENRQTQYKWETELQQWNCFLKWEAQHIPPYDNEKNSQLNDDVIIKRAEDKQPKKGEDDDEYGAQLKNDDIIHILPWYS